MKAIDFSDEAFRAVEPQSFDVPATASRAAREVPIPIGSPIDDLLSIPAAARLLDESRSTTWRRGQANQLEPVIVGKKKYVRRSQVLALRDAGKPPPESGPPPEKVIAVGRARAMSDAVGDQLASLVSEVAGLRTELRGLRTLILMGRNA